MAGGRATTINPTQLENFRRPSQTASISNFWRPSSPKAGAAPKGSATAAKDEAAWQAADLLFFAAFALNIIDVIGRIMFKKSLGTMLFLIPLYALLTFFAYKLFTTEITAEHQGKEISRQRTGQNKLLAYACLSAFVVLLPTIIGVIASLIPSLARAATFLLVFMPAWPMYILFFKSDKLSPATKKFAYIYIIIWWVLFFMLYAGSAYDFGIQQQNMTRQTTVLGSIWQGIAVKFGFVSNLTKYYTTDKMNQIYQMSYYEGQVDTNAQKPIGVYLTPLASAMPVYPAKTPATNSPVNVFTTLTAQTLDKPIDIFISCRADDGTDGQILSGPTMHVENFENPEINCVFKDGFEAAAGTSLIRTINLTAEYEFDTFSYLKTYFMDQDKIRSIRATGADPLTQYGIIDKNTKAVSTNGPVVMGSTLGDSLPIGIQKSQQAGAGQKMSLPITIENVWPGALKKIKNLYVLLPVGLEIVKKENGVGVMPNGVDYEKLPACPSEIKGCDTANQNVYSITKIPLIQNAQIKYTTIRIFIEVTDTGKLLGTTPIAMKSIWAIVKYDYALTGNIAVTIEGAKPAAN